MLRREFHPLEGVPVKITIRPPRAITVPTHFFKTDLPASLEKDYDFSLEYRVIQEVKTQRERQTKLEALRPTTAATVKEFTFLTPSQPSSADRPEKTSPPTPSNNISITEFEPEAFSPFDQVELQTINDLEELHSIFGGVRVSEVDAKHQPNSEYTKPTVEPIALHNPQLDDEKPKGIEPSGSPCHYQSVEQAKEIHPSLNCSQPDFFKDLPTKLQMMAQEIRTMGFPAERVAFAVMDFGEDKGKIVEHLCLIQNLVDEGFDAKDVSRALRFMAHDLGKSREFLKGMAQLTDLGFSKGDIALALKLHNNDPDKALDELLRS